MALNFYFARMKNLLASAILLLTLASCNNEEKPEKDNGATIDSAFAAQQKMAGNDSMPARARDTMHMVALPPVMAGDLVFQVMKDEHGNAMTAATGSKYNNVGVIFMRQRDGIYVVAEMRDSAKLTPLTEWVDRGDGDHVALMRLKLANVRLNEKKSDKLKTTMRSFKNRPYDAYFSWGDDALYSSEMVWKLYQSAVNIELCPVGTLGNFTFTGDSKIQMEKKYGGKIPVTDHAVSVDDLYKSAQLEKIYER
jgi:hypothetical protein